MRSAARMPSPSLTIRRIISLAPQMVDHMLSQLGGKLSVAKPSLGKPPLGKPDGALTSVWLHGAREIYLCPCGTRQTRVRSPTDPAASQNIEHQ